MNVVKGTQWHERPEELNICTSGTETETETEAKPRSKVLQSKHQLRPSGDRKDGKDKGRARGKTQGKARRRIRV